MVFNDPILAGNDIPLFPRLYGNSGRPLFPILLQVVRAKGIILLQFLAIPEAESHVYTGQMAIYARQMVVGVYSIFHSPTESHNLKNIRKGASQWLNHKIGEDRVTRASRSLVLSIDTVWVSKVGVKIIDTFGFFRTISV
jgi:hypothetical protein